MRIISMVMISIVIMQTYIDHMCNLSLYIYIHIYIYIYMYTHMYISPSSRHQGAAADARYIIMLSYAIL